jgi:hypothetical protein
VRRALGEAYARVEHEAPARDPGLVRGRGSPVISSGTELFQEAGSPSGLPRRGERVRRRRLASARPDRTSRDCTFSSTVSECSMIFSSASIVSSAPIRSLSCIGEHWRSAGTGSSE